MIIILGKGLIFWTGLLTGFLFILTFLGCRCINRISRENWAIKNHKWLTKATFISFAIHATLAILTNFKVYI